MSEKEFILPEIKESDLNNSNQAYYGNDHKKIVYDGSIFLKENEPLYLQLYLKDTGWIIIQFIKSEDNPDNARCHWEVRKGNIHIDFINFKNIIDSVFNDKIKLGILNNEEFGFIASVKMVGEQFIGNIQFFIGGKYE